MTEYITKEEAEKVARKCGLASADDTIYLRIQNTINLHIAQKFEVVGWEVKYEKEQPTWIYAGSFTAIQGKINEGLWPDIQYRPLYAIKGDSK
jgi:hypothetical protein